MNDEPNNLVLRILRGIDTKLDRLGERVDGLTAMDTNIPQSDKDELAGELLVGKGPIKAYLVYLGMPEDTDPYYLKRVGWPIGKTGGDGGGGSLIATKRRLTRHVQKLAAPSKPDSRLGLIERVEVSSD